MLRRGCSSAPCRRRCERCLGSFEAAVEVGATFAGQDCGHGWARRWADLRRLRTDDLTHPLGSRCGTHRLQTASLHSGYFTYFWNEMQHTFDQKSVAKLATSATRRYGNHAVPSLEPAAAHGSPGVRWNTLGWRVRCVSPTGSAVAPDGPRHFQHMVADADVSATRHTSRFPTGPAPSPAGFVGATDVTPI
jgi:hypothetical protein